MLGNPSSYANKKRKKPDLKQKKPSNGSDVVKSNPSKRHRDRLNGELERLTELLPFSEEVRTRLDKLSVLRLSVGYLRVKSYCSASIRSRRTSPLSPGASGQNGSSTDAAGSSEGDLLLQALNGFVMVVTSEGSVFYVSPTIKDYLGFHQSDVVHQSVFELIHTDDRESFRQQLHFALNPPAETDADGRQSCGSAVTYSPDQLPPENSSFLERTFVCRFRCLLDNSSGFLALSFQGRLKYLHGQNGLRDSRTCSHPQLALFTIAVPVHPPPIVEIRAKMLLFQSKHKLDFTPMGIDSRGRVVLGYSETELCMKGSGYQFIHAADMMYCADNHLRMIKTGESGMTVFRLLSKSSGWVWVKANAKLIYKGGRPDFIIAYQRALVNAEGEEYLRQRRLQLPFSFTTGEAVLYDTGPTVDISQFQFNKVFADGDLAKNVAPGSLLDSFLKQDETAYTNTSSSPLPVDQVFMNSRALLSIPSDAWPENGAASAAGVVKEEAKQSMMAVIDNLEREDLCSALRGLDADDTEVAQWENALNRLNQSEDHRNSVGSQLESVFTSDIFDYIDSILFKENGEDLNGTHPSCFSPANHLQEPLRPTAAGLCGPPSFPTPSPGCAYAPHCQQQGGLSASAGSTQTFSNTRKLSHLPSDVEAVPDASAAFQSCGRMHVGFPPEPSQHPRQILLQSQTELPSNGELLQSTVEQQLVDILSPLVPCGDVNPPALNVPVSFSSARLKNNLPLQTYNRQLQEWQQVPQAGVTQHVHGQMPAHHGLTSGNSILWSNNVPVLTPGQQGALACSRAATRSTCMFEQHFSSSPAGGDATTLSGSSGLRWGDVYMDQSPPQASCYFQHRHSEPVVGTSAISQEDVSISPLSDPSTPSSTEHAFSIQQYLGCHTQTLVSHCGMQNNYNMNIKGANE
uniref:Aryl hydrocarbon receptor n=1 Tax=Takifugu rubripes TaxID=31033 RepID=A0A3B5KGS7_TAKRU